MIRRALIKKGTYRDSITLLRITKQVADLPGVKQAALVMATPLNMRVLSDIGFADPALKQARTDDMVVALEAESEDALSSAITEAEGLLAKGEAPTSGVRMPRSVSEALASSPDANLAVVSVPGAFAKREGMAALNAGLNVFMFSSNVPKDDEKALKTLAVEKGVLMMGPDCGTAIINHVILGFGNAIRAGSIGIVSASGTGLQEVSTLIQRHGLGISQAIGTGGGDLSDKVGGLMTTHALGILEDDRQTKVIVMISKPPGPKTMKTVLKQVRASRKKIVVNFLGARPSKADLGEQFGAATLEEAALTACTLAGIKDGPARLDDRTISRMAYTETHLLAKEQKYIRGLYAGGTLCTEAQIVLTPVIGKVWSNAPFDPESEVDGSKPSKGHACIDMGADEFVMGRAHPMIDFTLRKMRIMQEARDPQTAVLLLDVELGLGSNPDPAGELVPTLREAKELCRKSGRYLSVVASVVGTDGDFQGLASQEAKLREAGVILTGSNARAASLAALIASRGETLGSRGGSR
jgi:FdrA protein